MTYRPPLVSTANVSNSFYHNLTVSQCGEGKEWVTFTTEFFTTDSVSQLYQLPLICSQSHAVTICGNGRGWVSMSGYLVINGLVSFSITPCHPDNLDSFDPIVHPFMGKKRQWWDMDHFDVRTNTAWVKTKQPILTNITMAPSQLCLMQISKLVSFQIWTFDNFST